MQGHVTVLSEERRLSELSRVFTALYSKFILLGQVLGFKILSNLTRHLSRSTHTHTLTITLSDQPLEMKPVKRKRGDRGEESEEETNGVAPPINDIYRARQQKRVHTAT